MYIHIYIYICLSKKTVFKVKMKRLRAKGYTPDKEKYK